MPAFSLGAALRRLSQRLRLSRKTPGDKDDFAYVNYVFQEIAKNMSQVFWADNYGKSHSILNVGNYTALYDRPVENLHKNNLDWLEAVHPDDRARVTAALPSQLIGRFDEIYRVVHRDGSVRWLHDRAFLIPDRDDARKLRAGIVEDITDVQKFREEVNQDQRMRAMGSIAGGVAHDFNNILAIIHGNLELALLDPTNAKTIEHLTVARDAAMRGADLTHRLLAYARRQPLDPGPIEPAPVLDGLRGLLKSALGPRIALEIAAPEDLWTCYADGRMLESVLLNLALNARDAMPEGGHLTLEAANVRLAVEDPLAERDLAPGDYVRFTVADDGAGMAPEVAARAFEPFFTTKGAGEGSGLGLAMAYGFAKQSGGHIAIETDPGRGTAMRLWLPRIRDHVCSAVRPDSRRAEPDAFKGRKALLVEDEDEVRAIVTAHLESLGFIVTAVDDAAAALVLCRSQAKFDLLLSDIGLPGGMDGRELANLVRSCLPGIAVILMSGYFGEAADHGEAPDPGAILLQKPFSRQALAAAVARGFQPAGADAGA